MLILHVRLDVTASKQGAVTKLYRVVTKIKVMADFTAGVVLPTYTILYLLKVKKQTRDQLCVCMCVTVIMIKCLGDNSCSSNYHKVGFNLFARCLYVCLWRDFISCPRFSVQFKIKTKAQFKDGCNLATALALQ